MQCPFSIRHEVLPDVNSRLRGFDDDVNIFSQVIYPVHGFSVFHSTDQKWRMDIASHEKRSDLESIRMERTEKDHTFI
jgi:hypothetical protein